MTPYEYSEDNIGSFIRAVSEPRFSRYLAFVGNERSEDACELYRLNIELSGAFLLPLHVLEVLLRNKCDEAISARHRKDWMHNGEVPFTEFQRRAIEEKLQKSGGVIHISDLDFGFWVQLFSPHRRNPWVTALHRMFERKPRVFKQAEIHHTLDVIRKMRNRIAHHEQILRVHHTEKNGTVVIVWTPSEYLEQIIEVLSWFNASAADWVKSHERVTTVLAEIEELKSQRGWKGF